MNILLCGNDYTYKGVELVVYTLLTHNKHCNIYIFTMDVEVDHKNGTMQVFCGYNQDQKSRLFRLVKYLDSTSNLCFIDAKEAYDKYLTPSPNELSPFTPYAALRLLADILLPNVNDVLYLDADVAITGNIEGVYRDYVSRDGNYSAYICQEACDFEGEMVSGVVLFNLRKNRETGFLERARKNYCKNPYTYPDQMALRDVDSPLQFPDGFGYCLDLKERSELPLIVHFTNQIFPKIYHCQDKMAIFWRTFPWLEYVKIGLSIFNTINYKNKGHLKSLI